MEASAALAKSLKSSPGDLGCRIDVSGKRFKKEVLEVTYQDKNIYDVLNMTKLFKIGAKISGEMASNLIGGLGVFAEKNGLIASTLFGEISNAAEEIAKFADMNYNNLVVIIHLLLLLNKQNRNID